MTLEILVAAALLSIAMLPLAALHTASTGQVRSLVREAAVCEMLGDRLTILRMGGWREHGICSGKEIGFFGEAGAGLPEGRLLLTVREDEDSTHLLEIVLSWRPERGRTIERTTVAFAPESDRRQ